MNQQAQKEAMERKRQEAIAWLGQRWVFHPAYQSRLPQHASTFEMLRPWWVRGRGVE
jgi:hypothetical protein